MLRRLLLVFAASVGAAVLVLALRFESIVRWFIVPRTPFDPAAVPSAPDYAQASAWSALPGQVPTAEVALPSLPAADPAKAAADVFYVHPTSYVGSKWNGAVDDAALNSATDRVATRLQASAFNGCCLVYAPRYRQSNGIVYTHPSSDGQRSIELAYQDVAQAFRYYLTHYNRGRPFFIASHSQGSMLSRRLLRDEIAGKPVRKQLVAAYLIGGAVTREFARHELPDIPVCAAAEQTGCLVSWNARGPMYQPGAFVFRDLPSDSQPWNRPGPQVCVNPLTWRQDEEQADAGMNEGAIFWEESTPPIRPGFADAQCRDGVLVVSHLDKPPRDFMSRLLDRALGPGNYHAIEYQIFFVNLRKNAQTRLAAYLSHP